LRVLLISDVYFPRINGVSSSIQTVLHGTSPGDEFCLITPDYESFWDEENHNVIRIPSYPTPGPHEDRVTNGLKIRDLLPQLRKKEFDLVHIHAFGIAFHEGVRLARMLKIPAI